MEIVSAILLSANAAVGAYLLWKHQERKESADNCKKELEEFRKRVFLDLGRTGLLPYFVVGLDGGISDLEVKASVRNDFKEKYEQLVAETKLIMEQAKSGNIETREETQRNG